MKPPNSFLPNKRNEEMGLWEMFPTWLPYEAACIVMAAAALAYIILGSAIVYGPVILSSLRLKLKGNNMPPLPPGKMGVPYWGESMDYISSCNDPQNPDVWYDRRKAEHGPIFKTHILGSPTVVILGPQANKFILINENKLFLNSWPKSVRVLIGEKAMVTSHGARHKRLRGIIYSVLGQQTLRKKAIDRFERPIIEHIRAEWKVGCIVRAHEKLMDMTLSVAAEFLMGLKSGEEFEGFKRHFHELSGGMLSHPLHLPWTAFGKAKRARAAIVGMIRSKIEERRSCGGSGGRFIEMVLSDSAGGEEEGRLSEEEIADNLIGLFAGGHDTTASALATLLKHLALAPHVLQRLRRDCQKLRDEKKAGEPLSWSDISGLHYLRNVISEGLRIVAPINGGFKQTKTDIVYKDYTIPKGWKVHYSTRQTNNKEEYFPNPEKFDPDRFDMPHEPFSYIPFGQGNRICPGNEFAKLEMQVFLYHLVLRYDWELVEAEEKTNMFFIPYPAHGLPLLLKPAPPSSATT